VKRTTGFAGSGLVGRSGDMWLLFRSDEDDVAKGFFDERFEGHAVILSS